MRGNFFRGVVLGSVTAVLVLSATTALAGTGVGGIFNLGSVNTVNATSSLSGGTSGTELVVSNTSTASTAHGLQVKGAGAGAALVAQNTVGPAAAFSSPSSSAPFTVSSAKKVANLNADLLDGLHSTSFMPVAGTAANSSKLGGYTAMHFLATTGTAANSSLLGGHAASYFLPTTGTAANSSLLGGLLPGAFLLATGTAADSSKLGGLQADTFFRLRTAPLANTLSTPVGGNGDWGTSVTIGADGLPLIAFYDTSIAGLDVAHCGDVACSSVAITTVDVAVNVGRFPSVTIGADGLPVISYYDTGAGDLRVAHCGDAACDSGNTVTVVDSSAAAVGEFTSVAIGTDGFPVISYYDATNTKLKVAHCGDVACTSATTTTVDNGAGTNDVGQYTSMTIGADGLPLISYYDNTIGNLKVAHCGTVDCSTGNTVTTADNSIYDVGQYSSATTGADGLTLISYYDKTNGDLKVAHCANVTCSSSTITTVDNGADVGQYTSVTVGSDGLPVIAYFDPGNGWLKVAHCATVDCSSGSSLVTVDNTGLMGEYAAVTIGADGLPLISYRNGIANGLKIAHCANAFCVPYFRRR